MTQLDLPAAAHRRRLDIKLDLFHWGAIAMDARRRGEESAAYREAADKCEALRAELRAAMGDTA